MEFRERLQILFALLIAAVPALGRSAEPWQAYKNEKYKYEVRYPDSYDVTITGPQEDRDGRTIRIALKNVSRMHGVDIKVYPGMSLERLLSRLKGPDFSKLSHGAVTITTELHDITWQKSELNGLPAAKMQARHRANGELFLVSLVMDGVVFTASPWCDAGLDDKAVEQIMSTFRWDRGADRGSDRGSHDKPHAGDGKYL